MSADAFGNVLTAVAALAGIGLLVLFVVSLIWIYNDAESHGKTGCLWLLLVWITWPLGALAYLVLRDRKVEL